MRSTTQTLARERVATRPVGLLLASVLGSLFFPDGYSCTPTMRDSVIII